MKLFLLKIVILLLCVPAYPFYVFFVHTERKSYFGSTSTYRKVSSEYWEDVKNALTYKEADK